MPPPGAKWVDLCGLDELSPDRARCIELADRRLAVFQIDGQVRVIDDTCPHAGGGLSGGLVRDGCVICPRHGWPFDLATGHCPDNARIAVTSYPVRTIGERVQMQLGK